MTTTLIRTDPCLRPHEIPGVGVVGKLVFFGEGREYMTTSLGIEHQVKHGSRDSWSIQIPGELKRSTKVDLHRTYPFYVRLPEEKRYAVYVPVQPIDLGEVVRSATDLEIQYQRHYRIPLAGEILDHEKTLDPRFPFGYKSTPKPVEYFEIAGAIRIVKTKTGEELERLQRRIDELTGVQIDVQDLKKLLLCFTIKEQPHARSIGGSPEGN